MVACGANGTFVVSFSNTENTAHNNSLFSIQFPEGMEYVAGSINNLASEQDISNLEQPIFSIPNITPLSYQEISFETIINCQFTNDSPILYNLETSSASYNIQDQALANYFFPEVVITNSTNDVLNLAVNGSGQRTFTIIQSTPDAVLDTLFFVNNYEAGMQSLGIDIGTLYGSGPGVDTFFITGNNLPGADGGFHFGESLLITETVQLLECTQANSSIELFWRCGNLVCQSFSLNTLVNQASGSPDLRITNTNGFSNQNEANTPSIVGGGFCDTLFLHYDLDNLGEEQAPGAGAVYDLILGIGLNNNLYNSSLPADLSIFPNWSIAASINGTPINLGTYHHPNPDPLMGYNIDFSQFDSDPDGVGGLDDIDGDGYFDDLAVGAHSSIQIAIIYDPYVTDECAYLSGYPYNGGSEVNFRMGYHYENQCNENRSYWYSVNDAGTNIVSLFTHRTVTYITGLEDINLFPGDTTLLDIKPDGAWKSPCGQTDSFVLEIILPDGLVAENYAYGPGDFHGIVAQNGDTVWLASTERGSLAQSWGLSLSVDCGEVIQDTTLDVSFLYFCSADCDIPKRINCEEIPLEYLPQCVECTEGIDTRSFNLERITLGWTDASHSQKVDPLLDPTINLKAAINYDSVDMQLTGIYRGNGPFDSLFAQVSYQGIDPFFADPTLPNFEVLGSDFSYFASDGTVYECSNTNSYLYYDSAHNVHYIELDLEAFFGLGNCLEQVNRQAGDSIVLTIHTLVTDNTPKRASPVPEFSAQFYLKSNGVERYCNKFLDNFVLEQVVPDLSIAYTTQEHYGCEAIYFNNNAIANPGHIYDSDQFPNEVRSAVDVNEVRIFLEGDWAITPASSELLANGSFDENDAVSTTAPFVTVPLAEPLVSYDGNFTLFTYNNDGSWPKGDLVIGGSNPVHNIRFSASPGCNSPQATPLLMRMEADMIRYPHAPAAYRDTLTTSKEDLSKTLIPPTAAMFLASPQEYIPYSELVEWELRFTNTSSYGHPNKTIENAWLAIEADPSVDIFEIIEITDPDNPIPFTVFNYQDGSHYWINIGSIAAFDSRIFRVNGHYTDCEPQELNAKFGYSCISSPNPDPEQGYLLANTPYSCPVQEMPLYIQPSEVSLVLEIESPPTPSPLCENLVYTASVSNLQLPAASNNELSVQMPLGAIYVSGSSQIEYPMNSGNWVAFDDPVYNGNNNWQWDIDNSPNGVNLLLGVDNAPFNAYRLRFEVLTECGFNAGLRFGFTSEALNSCGQIARRIAYSERLLIDGLPTVFNNYALRLQPQEEGLQACDTTQLNATLINLGPLPTSAYEYALLSIPNAFDLVDSSIQGNTTLVEELSVDDTRYLRFSLPEGMPAGDSLNFSIELADTGLDTLSCTNEQLALSAVLETEVPCSLVPEGVCAIFLVLNTDTISPPIEKDVFELELLAHESVIQNFSTELLHSTFKVNNVDDRISRSDSLVWEIYFDADDNDLVDESVDQLIYTSPIRYWQIDGLTSYTDSISYEATNGQLCRLIAVLKNPDINCMCAPYASIVLPGPVVRNTGDDDSLCSGDTISIGLDERISDISFEWSSLAGAPLGAIDNPNIAITTFSAINHTDDPIIYSYQLTTDRGGICSSSDTIQLTVWPRLQPSASVSSNYNGEEISCTGASDGSISILVNAATPPLMYSLAGNTQTSPNFNDLSAGTYLFEISDAHNCQTTIMQSIGEPDSLQLSFDLSHVSCFDGTDGAIQALASGGTPAIPNNTYNYQWSNTSLNNATNDNLASAWYQLTLEDANGCSLISDSLFIDQVTAIQYALSIDSTSCWYSSDGSIRIDSLAGGTAPYNVHWSNDLMGISNHSYPTGLHSFYIEDANGCIYPDSFSIEGPTPIQVANSELQHISCYGENDGFINVELIGGTGSYTYNWSNGDTSAQINELSVGAYQLNVQDANNCLLSVAPYQITQPDSLSLELFETQAISCYGHADGAATVVAQGGTSPYSYLWANGNTSPHAQQLAAGTYQISITDDKQCGREASIEITQPTALNASLTQIDPNCFGDNAFFIFDPTGGTAPYQYSIDGGLSFQTDAQFAVDTGYYQLLVQDAQGCSQQYEREVRMPLPIIIDAPESLTINYGDSVDIDTYIYNVRGDTIVQWESSAGLSCDDCLHPIASPSETQVYYLNISDDFNCTAQARIVLIVEHPRRYYLPNAFSPNGDSTNDLLYVFGAPEVARIQRFEIYNRWGHQVHAQKDIPANDPTYAWDGTFDGQLLPAAVYAYILEIEFTDGTVELYMGDVVLIR